MKKIVHVGLALALGLSTASAMAADPHAGHMAGHSASSAPASKAPMSEGEIKKIDKQAGKVTIKHGPLANLDMPPMTMSFAVKDAAMLDNLKVGDKIRFVAEKQGRGFQVARLEKAM